jgi:hypothetical protein
MDLNNFKKIQYTNHVMTGERIGISIYYDEVIPMFVPLDERNTDYQDILEWVKEEGNTIEEAD